MSSLRSRSPPVLREAESLSGVLAHSKMKLQVGNVKRYDPGIQFAAVAIGRGQIGKIQSVSCWYRVMAALWSQSKRPCSQL